MTDRVSAEATTVPVFTVLARNARCGFGMVSRFARRRRRSPGHPPRARPGRSVSCRDLSKISRRRDGIGRLARLASHAVCPGLQSEASSTIDRCCGSVYRSIRCICVALLRCAEVRLMCPVLRRVLQGPYSWTQSPELLQHPPREPARSFAARPQMLVVPMVRLRRCGAKGWRQPRNVPVADAFFSASAKVAVMA